METFGMVRPGSTLYVYFDTFAAATGAPITMTNFAVGDIKIYKNGSTTERSSTSGFTLLDTDGVDLDGITGIQGFSIDLSDNSDAGFYVAGARYQIVVSTVTIDSQTVSFIAGSFQIGYPQAILNTTIATLASQTSFTLTAGPAEDDALNGCEVLIHDIASAVQIGRAIVQDYTGSTKTVTLAAGATFTVAAGDNIAVMLSALQPTVKGRTLGVSASGVGDADAVALYGDAWAAAKLSAWMQACEFGTCQTGSTSTTIKLGLVSSSVNNFYKGIVYIYGGTGVGQARMLSGTYVGATKVANLAEGESWTTTPDNTSTFLYIPFAALVSDMNVIADHVLRRQMDNVEASANGDTLDKSSLYGMIQQAQESNTVDNAGALTIYKTDGTTELGRLTLATDAAADPVTGVS